ncbi:MAG: YesN/AraC family two-component response regulator [Sulfurimonas sp.]|jgi:YesN/AraC family two-component response regulator|uniref:response regulator n=1 Tax=Sulfurimonas sp. TaxID=2022749 RepID=UPI0039E504F1
MDNGKTKNINELIKKAKNISILYAEDEKLLRERTASFFKKIFADVDVAVDGREALDKYMINKYDIVITDIEMPNMDGLELINNIRKLNKEQEIIINSAYTETEFRSEANKYNVTKYIRKPIEINEIIKILGEYIDKINLLSKKDNGR